MSILDLGNEYNEYEDFSEPSNNIRNSIFILAICAAIAYALLRTTFAANISIGSGPVEFGQGISQTTACDNEITILPGSAFVNSSGAGSFALSTLTVSGINSGVGYCKDKAFLIKAFDNSSSSPITMFGSTTSIEVANDGTNFTLTPATGLTLSQPSGDNTQFTLTIDSANSPIAVGSVYKFTIESTDEVAEVVYSVGDVGPGGGWIVYVNRSTGFSCGLTLSQTCNYLEAAKANWNSGTNAFPWANDAYKDVFVGGRTTARDATKNCDVIGCGLKNTQAIIDQGNDATTAAGIARAYNGGGKTDWFLPSMDELHRVVTAIYGGSGDLANSFTWSSSEGKSSQIRARYQFPSATFPSAFYDNIDVKNSSKDVRPVRAF